MNNQLINQENPHFLNKKIIIITLTTKIKNN